MTLPAEAHANDNRTLPMRLGRVAFLFSLRLCVVSGYGLAALVSLFAMGTWAFVVASWLVQIIFAAAKAVVP